MTPVLATKLHIPRPHPNRVARPHLLDRMDEGLWHTTGVDFTRRLTLVAAPAGYGKTTLLYEWAYHLDIPFSWITFDEEDNDLGSFLQYLIAALQSIQPGIAASLLAVLQSPQFSTTGLAASAFMTALVNEIAAIFSPFMLIFDDYHALESAEINKAVAFLLDHMPETMSLAIGTRVDPPFSCSRLRSRRQMVEIRAENLRFSGEEAAVFLHHVMHLDLQDKDVDTLADRTEGWVAGLQMAALALQERSDAAGFIQQFSGRERFVIDYLFEEVLDRQSTVI